MRRTTRLFSVVPMVLVFAIPLAVVPAEAENPVPLRSEALDEPVIGPGAAPPSSPVRWEPGEVVVKFTKNALRVDLPAGWGSATDTGVPAFDALADRFRFREVRRYFGSYRPLTTDILDPARIALFRFSADADPLTVARALRKLPVVEYAHPHFIERPDMVPDDPLVGSQWHLDKINAPEAWDIESDCAGVMLAIDDNGMDFSHEDLVPSLWLNPDEDVVTPGVLTMDDCNGIDDGPDRDGDGLSGNGYIDDFFGAFDWWCSNNDPYIPPQISESWLALHGTHVGGIAGARGDNALGISGVCWAPTLMDAGTFAYLADMGADVINRSYSHLLCSDGQPTANKEAVDYAWSRGTIVVWSAGNDNRYLASLPPACQVPSLEVAATTSNDTRSGFSNFGPAVTVSAPGSTILSALPTGWPVLPSGGTETVPCTPNQPDPALDCYDSRSGTSQAAPVITGVLGLTIAAHRDDPTWYDPSCPMGSLEACSWAPPEQCPPCRPSAAKIVAHVEGTAESIDANNLDTWGWLGQGRVDAFRAVSETGPVPQLRAVSVTPDDAAPGGDGDGIPEFGEEVELVVTVAQQYGAAGGPIAGTLSVHPSYSSFVTVTKADGWFGLIPAGEERDCGSDPFRITVDSPDLAQRVYFHLDLDDGAGYTTRETIGLLLSGGGESGYPSPVLDPTTTSTSDFGQPTLVDLDGDGTLESVFTADGVIHARHGDGTVVAGFPIASSDTTFGHYTNSQPVVVEDADLDGRFEFFAGCSALGDVSSSRGLCAVRVDGTELVDGDENPSTWGMFVDFNVSTRLRTPPVLADLDGDGRLDAILTTQQPGELLAVDMTGQPLPGFPVTPPAGYFYHGAVAVGDLDHDAVPEIVTARATTDPNCPTPTALNHCDADQVLEVRNADGSLRWSQPVDVAADRDNAPAPLIADMNRDGTPDVVSGTGASLYVFEADGTELPGSPITVPVEPFNPGQGGTLCKPEANFTHLVEVESLLPAVDLDGNGWPELVVRDEQILQSPMFNASHQRFTCRRHMRIVRWDEPSGQLTADPPITVSTSERLRSPLLAADFGSGPQIVYANDVSLVLYDNALGNRETRYFASRRWPTTTTSVHFPGSLSLSLGDADGDGVVEAQIPLNDGNLHSWGIESGVSSEVLWGSPHHDRWMTRVWAAGPPPSYACDEIVTEGTLTQDQGWGPHCNPILLTGPLTVPSGRALTIRPGTIVEAVDPSAALIVDGALIVDATWDARVTFRAPGGDWEGIVVRSPATTALTGLDVNDARIGLRLENVSPTVNWSRFGGNVTGIEVEGINGRPLLERVLYTGNGSGLRLVGGGQPWTPTRSVFYGNGVGLDNAANTADAFVSNSIFWSNTTDVAGSPSAEVRPSYSILEQIGGYDEGPGVLHADPRFVDAAAEDFHLLSDSPAIDSASTSASYLNEPDPNGCRSNMGMYGDTAEATSLAGEFRHCSCANLTLSGTLAADTTWTPACNPIRLQGPLTVPAGMTLTVQPGTLVEGGTTDSEIVVDGVLSADGLPSDLVRFAGYAGGPWAGLDLRGAGGHVLRFAEVRFADRTRVMSDAAVVERSRFLENVTGLVLDGAVPSVRNNVFARNTSGVEVVGPASPRIDLSTFYANGTAIRDAGLPPGETAGVGDSIFWMNGSECEAVLGEIDVEHSIVRADARCGVLNRVSGSPRFVDTGSDDYHQLDDSDGIDAGNPTTNYFNEPDPNGCRANLGAYGDTEEATSDPATLADCNCHGITVSGGIGAQTIEFWPIECSPIRLQSDFEVAGILSIEEGVVVEVPGYEIDVTGTLISVGEPGLPITFREYGAGRWDGLVLGSGGNNRLEFTRIEHATGVEVLGSTSTIRRSDIVDGGTGLIVHGTPIVENVLLVANDLAVDVRNSSQVDLNHLTVVRNTVGLESTAVVPTNVANSIFWLNTLEDIGATASVDLTYSITEGTGGPMEGVGVLHADPRFAVVDPDDDWTLEDYHLQDNSPAMDQGDPSAPFTTEAFPNGCRANMGAYGDTADSTPSAGELHCNCPGVPSAYNGQVTEDLLWTADCGPYTVYGLLEVMPGATLTIEPGTTVVFRDAPLESAVLKIHGGRLIAIGTPDERIVFDDGDGTHRGRLLCYNNYYDFPECRLAYFDFQNLDGYYSLTSATGPHTDSLEHGRFYNNRFGVHSTYTTTPLVKNCLFEGNWTAIYGGQRGYPQIESSTFVGNDMGVRVGAYPFVPDPITITNSVFWGNVENDLVGWEPGDPKIILRYTLTERVGEVIEAEGVLHDDPLFVDQAAGDYRLQSASPAVDAGDPASPYDQEPQPNGCRINLGFDGNTPGATVSSDPDGDGLHGACDPCPNDPFNDIDGDGYCADVDCAPANPGLWGPPEEVAGVGFAAGKTWLAWDSVGSGNGESYDVARALLSGLPVGGGDPSETCLSSGGTTSTTLEDTELPPVGDGFWYLVRGSNVCGVGGYGADSGGLERLITVCP